MLLPTLVTALISEPALGSQLHSSGGEGLHSWHGPKELFVWLGHASTSKAEFPGRHCSKESQKEQRLKDMHLFLSFQSVASFETALCQGESQRCYQLCICFFDSRE